MLQSAIEQNYCAYSNLRLDPMLRKIRQTPGFENLLKAAEECQQSVRLPNNSPNEAGAP
jgi:hypothetical protein